VRRDVGPGAQRRELRRHRLAKFIAEPAPQELDRLRAVRFCRWAKQVVDRPAVRTLFKVELFLAITRVGALGVWSKGDLRIEKACELGTDDRIGSFELRHPGNGTIVERLRFQSWPKVKLGILQRWSAGRQLAECDLCKRLNALMAAALLHTPLLNQLAKLVSHFGIRRVIHRQSQISVGR